jgi:hypothetical protein
MLHVNWCVRVLYQCFAGVVASIFKVMQRQYLSKLRYLKKDTLITYVPVCLHAHVCDCWETPGFRHVVNEIVAVLGRNAAYIND